MIDSQSKYQKHVNFHAALHCKYLMLHLSCGTSFLLLFVSYQSGDSLCFLSVCYIIITQLFSSSGSNPGLVVISRGISTLILKPRFSQTLSLYCHLSFPYADLLEFDHSDFGSHWLR